MKWENDTFGLVLRMRLMVYDSKDFNIVDVFYDSAKYASIMVFATPESRLKKISINKTLQ